MKQIRTAESDLQDESKAGVKRPGFLNYIFIINECLILIPADTKSVSLHLDLIDQHPQS